MQLDICILLNRESNKYVSLTFSNINNYILFYEMCFKTQHTIFKEIKRPYCNCS